MVSMGDGAQTRAIGEQIGEAIAEKVLARFVAQHPEVKALDIPAPLKWAGGIVAALFVMGIGATATWLVSTTNNTQMTVGRIDERIRYMVEKDDRSDNENNRRFDDFDRRITKLEGKF